MRTLSPEAAAVLASGHAPMAVLVDMALTQPLRLCTGGMNLELNGATYLGTLGLGKLGALTEANAEVKGLTFSLSGVPAASVALALTEPTRGKAVALQVVVFDPASGQVLDVRSRWSGTLEPLVLESGAPTWSITVSAEHRAIDLLRPRPVYWSDADQRARYGGDPSLQYMADQVEMRVVWPARTFFVQP